MRASLCVGILLAGLSCPLLAQQDTVPATLATQSGDQASPTPQLQRHGSEDGANPNRPVTAVTSNPQFTLDVVVTDAAQSGTGLAVAGLHCAG
jgi:hypothetical protein